MNRNPFEFAVSPDCPSDHIINFGLAVTAGEVSWNRMFSLRVEANKLQYHSFMINDYNGNFNGVIDAGEQIQLIINLKNDSAVEARNINMTLSSEFLNLQILNPIIAISNIPENQIMQAVFNLDFLLSTAREPLSRCTLRHPR